MPLNKPSCRFSICNHLFQFLRGQSKSRPPGEFPYEPFKTLNHSHISYHGSPASVFSVWWCNPFARSAGKFFKLYKICILLHRCNLKILAKNRFEKSAIFVKIQQKLCECRKICKFCQISKISAR